MKNYIQLVRPFTLLAPLIGFIAGAVVGAHGLPPVISIAGALAASLLNAASNSINQIFDREIDAINKPDRPLPSGKISVKSAGWFSFFLYVASVLLAASVNLYFLLIVIFTAAITAAYSVPPLRLKRVFLLSNFVIAVPRGCLLIVAGWASATPVLNDGWYGLTPLMNPEPWILGSILGLFVFGAASTKDFADIEGDRKYGCKTLPVVLGIKRSILFITPFLIFPFIIMAIPMLFPGLEILSGNGYILSVAGALLALWGIATAGMLYKDPDKLAGDENHPAWWSMYLMLIFAQLSYAAAYFFN